MLSEPDPIQLVAGLNRVLSEMIDGISEVKVALWRSKRTRVLHAELDQLLRDLIRWTHSLGDRDFLLGVSVVVYDEPCRESTAADSFKRKRD